MMSEKGKSLIKGNSEDSSIGIYRKLVWISLFRLAVVTVLLLSTLVLVITEKDPLTGPVQIRLYGLTIAVYVISLFYLIAMRWGPPVWHVWIAYIQVAGDVIMAAFLVWLTGGGESVFPFLFSLGIINGSILLYRPGAIFGAALSSIAFAFVTIGLQLGRIAPAADYMTIQAMQPSRLFFTIFINAAGYFLVAILASYISEQERRADRRLFMVEEGLAALTELHERIVQSVASGILTLDSAGKVGFVNRAGEALLGGAASSWHGNYLEAVFPELAKGIEKAHIKDASHAGEVEASINGESRQIGFSVTDLSSPAGKIVGRVVVFQDLTSIRRMEEQMKRNTRLAAAGVLAAGLAHEIRNPLSSLSGSIELLKSDISPDEGQSRLMDIVIRETERLDRLLADFLGFAMPAPPSMKIFSVNRIISDAIEKIKNEPSSALCEIQVDIPEELFGWGDEKQIERAFSNLLINAAQAMEGRGRIRVSAEISDNLLSISVSDEGPGISSEEMEKIFDPFHTAKERSRGLGLAIVHRIVESHAGHVEVKSDMENGSTFIMVLPFPDNKVIQ